MVYLCELLFVYNCFFLSIKKAHNFLVVFFPIVCSYLFKMAFIFCQPLFRLIVRNLSKNQLKNRFINIQNPLEANLR